jgi:hypothetical protein
MYQVWRAVQGIDEVNDDVAVVNVYSIVGGV